MDNFDKPELEIRRKLPRVNVESEPWNRPSLHAGGMFLGVVGEQGVPRD